MTYKVKYKRPDDFRWKSIKKVKGDGIMTEAPYRFFILDDESRIEIPLGCIFKFSSGRFLLIKKRMEQESGQQIITGERS
jgi:hypothetical protein